MRNLHKLFYKDYFEHCVEIENRDRHKEEKKISYEFLTNEHESKKIQELNAKILNHKEGVNQMLTSSTIQLQVIPNDACNKENSFSLITLYPGLITGVGIDHEAGIEGEFKLGVHFDYTWGMPVIYGSSVKGVLRAYFLDFAKEYFKDKSEYEFSTEKEFDNFLTNAFNDIFEGEKNGAYKSIYDRDIFFDAVVVEKNKNGEGKILDSDTLCPHGENPLKNPIPISFLKIASGVTIEFRFKLVESTIGDETTINRADKVAIFKEILTTVGIGAKTNVGYGQFSEVKLFHSLDFKGKTKKGTILNAIVANVDQKLVEISINGQKSQVKASISNCPPKDTIIEVEIVSIRNNGQIDMVRFKKLTSIP